jgi:hypothetical protein
VILIKTDTMSCIITAVLLLLTPRVAPLPLPIPPPSLLAARLAPTLPPAPAAGFPPPFGAFDIRLYGALGDGITDCTPALQAALDAALAARGGTVFIPAGVWRVAGGVRAAPASTVPVSLRGEGWASALLWEQDADLFTFAPADGSPLAHAFFADFAVFCAGPAPKSAASTALRFPSGIVRSTLSTLLFYGSGPLPNASLGSAVTCGTNIDLGGRAVTDTVTVRDTLHWFFRGTGVVIGRGSEVRILGGRIVGMGTRSDGSVGVHVTGNNGGVHVSETDVIGLGTGILLDNASGAGSNRETFITHATMDSDNVGLLVNDSSYVSIAGCWAASSDQAQVLLAEGAAGAHVAIVGGTIFNGGSLAPEGACAAGDAGLGCNGIEVRAGDFSLNGVLIWANKGVGLHVADAGVGGFTVNGCRFEGNGQGASVPPASREYAFVGNVLRNNRLPSALGGDPSAVVASNVNADGAGRPAAAGPKPARRASLPTRRLPPCNPGGKWAGACEWPSVPPPDCPFPPSAALSGVSFTGAYGSYPGTTADTWLPSLGADGNLYTTFADGGACTGTASPGPPAPGLVPLQWYWSADALDNALTTAAAPLDPSVAYELVGTIGYALAEAPPGGGAPACQLALFRAPAGMREYWTTCGAEEAANATAAGYALVAPLGAWLPLAPPAQPGPRVPPTSAVNMPPGAPSGWVGAWQLFSAERGDHYATPEHVVPPGYAVARPSLGSMRVELPACATVSGGNAGVQGWGVLTGDAPFNLSLTAVGRVPHPLFNADVGFPGELGLYPSTSFVFRGQWVYGYYLLADPNGAGCSNWCHLGPLVAFGVANVSELLAGGGGWSFAGSPYWGSGVERGVFEDLSVVEPIKLGVPRFVDFGADLEHSPDGRAYLIGKGCDRNDGVHCSFMTGDAAYLVRTVVPVDALGSLTALNAASAWEFWGGSGVGWMASLGDAAPLFSWPTGVGILSMTYNAPLKMFFVVSNLPSDRVHPTDCSFDTYILEANAITGPFSLVSYMPKLGPQMRVVLKRLATPPPPRPRDYYLKPLLTFP